MDETVQERLRVLEERSLFQDHLLEQLGDEIRRAWRQIEHLERQVEGLRQSRIKGSPCHDESVGEDGGDLPGDGDDSCLSPDK